MSVVNSGPFARINMAAAEDYGGLAPHGLAYGFATVTGDASAGNTFLSITSEGGFLYRLEASQISAVLTNGNAHLRLRPEWLTDAAPEKPAVPELIFTTNRRASAGLSIYELAGNEDQIRRVPVGVSQASLATPTTALSLYNVTWENNVDLNVATLQIIASWWPMRVLTRPGFLRAFYEAPTPISSP